MAIQFPTWSEYASLTPFSFLDGATSFSWSIRVKLLSLGSVAQYIFRHTGPNGQFNIRREPGPPSYWKATVTATNTLFCTQSPAGSPVVDTVYTLSYSWQPIAGNGFRFWVDGVEAAAASTTSQVGYVYNPGSGSVMYLAQRQAGSNPGYCGIESFVIVKNYLWTQKDIDLLIECGHPYSLPASAQPMVYYQCDPSLTNRIPDLGGQGQHFEAANISGTLTPGGYYGKFEEEYVDDWVGSVDPDSSAAPPGPGPWLSGGEVLQSDSPNNQITISGLTPGTTYQFRVFAEDAVPNRSAESAYASSMPSSLPTHSSRQRYFGHP